MMQTIRTIWPSEFVNAARKSDLERFMEVYGDAPLLLVKLPPGSDKVAQVLTVTVTKPKQENVMTITPMPQNLTEAVSVLANPALPKHMPPTAFGPDWLREALAVCRHFILPLRPRTEEKGPVGARISVGRSFDCDVVLHDSTVSKTHGWFQPTDDGEVSFTDANGPNSARVNGRRLAPGETVRLAYGDTVRLGRVEMILSPADVLWMAIRPAQRDQQTPPPAKMD